MANKLLPLLGCVLLCGFGCANAGLPGPTEKTVSMVSGTSTQEIVRGGLAVPVPGSEDVHCAEAAPIIVDPGICHANSSDNNTMDVSAMIDETSTSTPKNAIGDCRNTDPEYGDILYGTKGDDDDCKYHVAWSVARAGDDQHATFTITLKSMADGSPVTGATPSVELYNPCDGHRDPNSDREATAAETSPGSYSIGPMTFDESGHWAVRFHMFPECTDAPTSPHGHAAFYLNVP